MSERVKLSDVAAAAGVSMATVSRVLNSNKQVAPDLAERVLKAKDELGYRQNRLARGLRTRASNVIGVVVPDVTNPFFTDLVRGMEDAAHESDYLLVLCDTDETATREAKYLEMLLDHRVAGVVIAPAPLEEGSTASTMLEGVPTVLVDRLVPELDADSVTMDNLTGARELTDYLLEHADRVAIITGPLTTSPARERLAGFQGALNVAGISLRPEYFIESNHLEEGGFSATLQLLDLGDPPNAILVGNNVMAQGMMRALKERDQDPMDFALGSFGQLGWLADPAQHVAALGLPAYEMGRTAGRMLIERIQGLTGPARRIQIPLKRVV